MKFEKNEYVDQYEYEDQCEVIEENIKASLHKQIEHKFIQGSTGCFQCCVGVQGRI